MKKIFISLIVIFAVLSVQAQENKTDLLEALEQDQPVNPAAESQPENPNEQDVVMIAKLKSATRLFGEKYDLTSVITVLPAGIELEILDSDSTYLHVAIEDYEGYIYEDHAIISEATQPVPVPVAEEPEAVEEPVKQTQPVQHQPVSRFTYLENKYGSNMAAKLMAGKVWKGMNAEMIKDSWGNPRKINRVISSNVIKEEWVFKNTWLYLENDILTEWGPIR